MRHNFFKSINLPSIYFSFVGSFMSCWKQILIIVFIVINILLLALSIVSDYDGLIKKNKILSFQNTSTYTRLDEKDKTIFTFIELNKYFSHGIAKHTFSSNWIMFSLGKIHSTLGTVYVDRNLFKNKKLICSQSSYLLLKVLESQGIRTRHISLYYENKGHVVLEVWFNGDWHMFDSDYQIFLSEKDKVLGIDELINSPDILKKYYDNDEVVNLFLHEEGHSYVSYPQGSYFEWKTNLLKYYEVLMEFLKYLILILLILVAWRRLNV